MTEFVQYWFFLVLMMVALLIFLVIEVRRIRIATEKIANKPKSE